jgi:hypothetical protein
VVLGLALAAPQLSATTAYLRDSALGGHQNDGFYGVYLNINAAIQQVVPYIYGPIFGFPSSPIVTEIWGSIGGYFGFLPLWFALIALLSFERITSKLILVGWIIIAFGVTFGLPVIYNAFMAVPLTRIAACYRYITVSQIFCFTFLSAIYLEEIQETAYIRRKTVVGCLLACLIITALFATSRPVIAASWAENELGKWFIIASCGGLLVMIVLVFVATSLPTRPSVFGLATLLLVEATVLFIVPYFSYPRGGSPDASLIGFLRDRAGFDRVIGTEALTLSPNYGSYYGISTINYNDLPSPIRTAEYIKRNLDPFANSIIYIPQPFGLNAEQQRQRRTLFFGSLGKYANVGVRYIMVPASGGLSISAIETEPKGQYPYALEDGSELKIEIHKPSSVQFPVTALSVLIGTYGGSARGTLKATLCVRLECGSGE